MKAFWVTFYSYKGGVGRSMALANVAGLLAREGRRVLMVDFDLEAPGLDSFEEFRVPSDQPGLVEYVSSYLESGVAPAVQAYVQKVALPDRARGQLWLLPAGKKDGVYNRQRSAIRWGEFYQERDGALFFENFKADVEDTFHPDYVLIDSRTGLTDVGGICTAHLPSLVVLLFALNEQNLRGIAGVVKALQKSERAPSLLTVASPVPNFPRGSEGPLEERFQRVRELLGIEPAVTLQYSSAVSLREKVYALEEHPKPTLIELQYEQLKAAIVAANPEGLDALIRQADSCIGEFNTALAKDLQTALTQEFPDRGEGWFWYAELAKLLGDSESYVTGLKKALAVDPNYRDAFDKLQSFLGANRRWEEVEATLRDLLSQDSRMQDSLRDHWEHQMGVLLMHQKRPREAYDHFLRVYTSDHAENGPDARLVGSFNLAEAARRAQQLSAVSWSEVVRRFEAYQPALATENPNLRLNRLQAMHIPYACLGNCSQAVALLEEAAKLATHFSPRERLFSVADYREVTRDEFLEQNNRMIEALRQGKLWDGYLLSPLPFSPPAPIPPPPPT